MLKSIFKPKNMNNNKMVEKYFIPVKHDRAFKKVLKYIIDANMLVLGRGFRVCLLEFYPFEIYRWIKMIGSKKEENIILHRLPITKPKMFHLVKELVKKSWIIFDIGYYVENEEYKWIEELLEKEEYTKLISAIEEDMDLYANVRTFYLTKRGKNNELVIDIIYNSLRIRDHIKLINDYEYMDLITIINNIYK